MGNLKPFDLRFNVKGVDQKSGLFFKQPQSAENIENLHMLQAGTWSSYRQGFDRFTAQLESGADVDGVGWYTKDDGTTYLAAAVNGKLKNIDTSTGAVTSEISTGLTAGNPVDFETFQGTFFVTDGGHTPVKWTGTGSVSTISALPLTIGTDVYDKPKLVEKHNNSLVYGNFQGTAKFPSHIVILDNLATDTYTSSPGVANGAVWQISPGDGQALVGMKSLMLPNQNEGVLVLFKERSIYALSGYNQDEFALYIVNSAVGALNNRVIVTVGQDVLFLDQSNVFSLTTASQSGSIAPKAIGSESIRETLRTLNTTYKHKAWAVHLPWRSEVWWGIPTDANTTVDTILVYRYPSNDLEAPVWSIKKGHSATCAVVDNEQQTLYTGDTDGYLNKWFANSQYNATAPNWVYEYPWFDFKAPSQVKQLRELTAWLELKESASVTIRTQWRDGSRVLSKSYSKTITLPDTGATYGTALYGVSSFGASTVQIPIKVPIFGNGEMIKLSIQGNVGANGPAFLGFSGLVEYGKPARSY